MTREELKFHFQGPIATVPTPFDDKYEIDYGVMHEMTQWWVEQGLVKGKVQKNGLSRPKTLLASALSPSV